MAAPFCIPTNSAQGFQFPYLLPNTYYFLFSCRNDLLTSLEAMPIRRGGLGPGGKGWLQTTPLTAQFSADSCVAGGTQVLCHPQ